jgi:hypothetical protein
MFGNSSSIYYHFRWEYCLSRYLSDARPFRLQYASWNDCVYAMNVVVYTLFCVIHFPHNEIIVTIYHLSSDNHHPILALAQVFPLCVPSVRVHSSPPWVNYVASYTWCSIVPNMGPLHSGIPS